jgi:hypothetical protein
MSLAAVLSVAGVVGVALGRDLWVHPRGDVFDPAVHYRDPSDPDGEIYYKAENDIGKALGDITIGRRGRPLVTMTIGEDILDEARESNGSIRPVLLWDSDADGRVDRSATGRIEGIEAQFDSPDLADVNLQIVRWQLGVRYIAGAGGDTKLDGRYLASVDSSNANIAFVRDEEMQPPAEPAKAAAVGAIEAPGLVILKHRPEEAFDLAAFAEDPTQFVEDFDRLTRGEDGDDWNAGDRLKGKLATHFSDEDLFIVRTQGGATLGVEWGDMPMVEFFRDYLAVEPDAEGCYSSLSTQLLNDDQSPVTVPHRWFYCPNESVALFDIPDGYEVGLTATFKDEVIDNTKAGTSVADNIRLYAKEVYPRSPRTRATGTVTGNLGASFVAAGSDAKDILRHAVTGTRPESIHTGQRVYQASPITAVPRALFDLVRLQPLEAVGELLDGVDSTVQIGASAVSAVNNTVVNPLVQATVGTALSAEAADSTGHWVGAATMAAARNLPGADRNVDAVSPIAAWQHNRAFAQMHYTRTDTQLNIDRIMTVIDAVALASINNSDNGSEPDKKKGNDPVKPGNPNNPKPHDPYCPPRGWGKPKPYYKHPRHYRKVRHYKPRWKSHGLKKHGYKHGLKKHGYKHGLKKHGYKHVAKKGHHAVRKGHIFAKGKGHFFSKGKGHFERGLKKYASGY